MSTPPGRELELVRLDLVDVRTFAQLRLELGSGTTLFVGPNGVGKTNLLEAAATVLAGASPRTSNELRLIRDEEPACSLRATVRLDGSSYEREVRFERGRGKSLRLDGSAARSVDEFAASTPSLVFLPERLLVIRGAPARRRALLDGLVTRLQPNRARVFRDYARVLQQRNALLRQGRSGRDVSRQLDPWDEQVAALALQIRTARHELLAALAAPFAQELLELTGLQGGTFELDPRGPDTLADALVEQRPIDIRRGSTTLGPHLDDVLPRQAGRDLRAFGSTGEQRASLLAFTLAAARLVRDATGVSPVLLLDEPWSELDADRRRRLSERIAAEHQVICTTTEPPRHLDSTHAGVPLTVRAVTSGQVT